MYSLRNRDVKRKREEDEEPENKKLKFDSDSDSDYDPNESENSSESDSDSESINSEDLTDIDDNCDDESIKSHNLEVLNEESLQRKLQRSIIKKMITEVESMDNEKIIINDYLNDKEKNINNSELEKDNKYKNDIISSSAVGVTNSILKSLINEIRYESDSNEDFNLLNYLKNKLEILNEVDELVNDKMFLDQPTTGKSGHIIFNLMVDPLKYLQNLNPNQEEYEEYEEDEDYEKERPGKKDKYDKQFLEFLQNGMITPKDDFKYFKSLSKEKKQEYLETIEELKKSHKVEKPKILKIIESDLNFNNKSVILNKLQNFESLPPFSSDYFKLKNWVDGIMKVPFGVYKDAPVTLRSKKSEIKKYMKKVRKHMDDAVFGHEQAKKQILQVIAHTITNPREGGSIIAIQGPPGVGKTQLIQDGISKALDRPFEFISLGGATDSAFLEGFEYTYEGSRWGKIADCLMKAKCMNPVIFFDELDKVSDTPKGEEIINILTHLTDHTQNHHYNDKFFQGIDFDLSKAIFIFSFNDEWKINRILKDRMYIIRTEGFQINDKLKIADKYLTPKILKSVGFEQEDIIFSEEIIRFIIENYTFEGGVRRLKECILEITKEINLRKLTSTRVNGKKIKFPIKITESILKNDIFKKRNIVIPDKIHPYPKVGLVNGLWANDQGVGGLIPIEAFSIPTNNKLELELTGMQGDVMKESMRVAKTVAWNIIPDSYKKKLNTEWKNFGNTGLHIHCPDGSTPKDGPSAGAAITTAIISLLMNQKVNNEIAMTGEINLKGEVTEIGGLTEKLIGAKKAGAKHVLIPKNNERQLTKLVNSVNNPLDSNFKVTMVENIWEVFNYVFQKNIPTIKY